MTAQEIAKRVFAELSYEVPDLGVLAGTPEYTRCVHAWKAARYDAARAVAARALLTQSQEDCNASHGERRG